MPQPLGRRAPVQLLQPALRHLHHLPNRARPEVARHAVPKLAAQAPDPPDGQRPQEARGHGRHDERLLRRLVHPRGQLRQELGRGYSAGARESKLGQHGLARVVQDGGAAEQEPLARGPQRGGPLPPGVRGGGQAAGARGALLWLELLPLRDVAPPELLPGQHLWSGGRGATIVVLPIPIARRCRCCRRWCARPFPLQPRKLGLPPEALEELRAKATRGQQRPRRQGQVKVAFVDRGAFRRGGARQDLDDLGAWCVWCWWVWVLGCVRP